MTIAPLAGTEHVAVQTVVAGAVSDSTSNAKAVAMLALAIPPRVNTNLATVGNGTLLAAALIGGIITRTGPTGDFTDTTDTALLILAGLPAEAPVNTSWPVYIRNTTAFTQTIAAGSGVAQVGGMVIPPNSTGIFIARYTSSIQVTLYGVLVAGGVDPSSQLTLFGGGDSTFRPEGTFYSEFDSAGVHPGSTGNDNVCSVFTITAASLDQAGRGVLTRAKGSFASNGDTKELKIVVNPSAAVVGSAVTGGTTIADSGAVTTSGGGWEIEAEFWKYGANGSNTQMGSGKYTGAAAVQPNAPQLITATESGDILVAICGNCTTTATDILVKQVIAKAMD